MRISFNTPIVPEKLSAHNGYGYATERMLASLANLGYEVTVNDPKADVGLCFNQPQHWKFYGNQYKIGYHPWESTLLMDGWADIMNECDEVWTPSPIIADWYRRFSGVTVPVYVYQHGVDDIWTPVNRTVDDKFRFLHVGGEAARKGAKEVMGAFLRAFPSGKKDVELNMKVITKGWKIGNINRINIINERTSIEELIRLYHNNHVYVYPSYGEGFGLTPLQAMATGMPTITVPKWAPYAHYLDPDLTVDASFTKSPWPMLHPGNMLKPKMDELVDRMRLAYDTYDDRANFAMDMVEPIKREYDWDRLTDETFSTLSERLK